MQLTPKEQREQVIQLNLHLGLRLIAEASKSNRQLKQCELIANAYLSDMSSQIASNQAMVVLLSNRKTVLEPLIKAITNAPDYESLLTVQSYLEGLEQGKVAFVEDNDQDISNRVFTRSEVRKLISLSAAMVADGKTIDEVEYILENHIA